MTPYEIGLQYGRTGVRPDPRPWFCSTQIGTEDEVTSSSAGLAFSKFHDGIAAGQREAWQAERRDGEDFLTWWRRTRSAR